MSQRQEDYVRHYTRYLEDRDNIDHALTRLLEVTTSHKVFHKYDTKRYALGYVHHREHDRKARSLIKKIDSLCHESEKRTRKAEKRRRSEEEKSDQSSSKYSNSPCLADLYCEKVTLKTLNKHRRALETLPGEGLLRIVEKNREIAKEVDHMFRKLIKKDFSGRCYLLEQDMGDTETYKDVYKRFVEDQKKEKEGPPSKKYKDKDGKVMHLVEKISFGEDDDDDYM